MITTSKKQFFTALFILAITASCTEDEGEQYRVTVNEIIYNSDCKSQAVAGCTVKLYTTEQDYLLDENVFAETVSDNVGRALFDVPVKNYWYRAYRGDYTHDRFAADVNFYDNKLTETDKSAICILAPKPIRLDLQFKDQNLNPLGKDYYVFLYDTESDYLNRSSNNGYSFNCLRIGRSKYTTAEGIVQYPNLEAKEYWFRIFAPGNKELKTSIVKTPKPLEDNMEIVNSLDVIVQL